MSGEGQGMVGEGFPCVLPCGGRPGCLCAGAGACQGTNAVPLLPVSQSGGPLSSFPLQERKTLLGKKIKRERGPVVGRRTRFAEPCCSSDLFKPLIFPLP